MNIYIGSIIFLLCVAIVIISQQYHLANIKKRTFTIEGVKFTVSPNTTHIRVYMLKGEPYIHEYELDDKDANAREGFIKVK